MSSSNTPNIFSHGTSELTQDAFIAWLCEWARPEFKEAEPKLNKVATTLLSEFFSKHGKQLPDIESLKVVTQWKNIDVFVEVNDEYFVIVEDKVHSKEHSDQLKRYRETVEKRDGVEKDKIIPIYFKTGDQANYKKADDDGYTVFKRSDFLNILKDGREKGIENSIFLEYLHYLEGIEREVERYKELQPKDWNKSQWKGFFKFLSSEFNDSNNWRYVPNHSGGFMGFWWNRKTNIDGHDIYLQIEGPKLCFKISTAPEGTVVHRDKKWEWLNIVREQANEMGIPVDKPSRLGHGKWVTFAVWQTEGKSKTWIPTTNEDKPDLQQVIQRLELASKLLDRSVQTYNG